MLDVFVCLFQSQAIRSCEDPQGSGFLRARPFVLPPQGQSCSDFEDIFLIFDWEKLAALSIFKEMQGWNFTYGFTESVFEFIKFTEIRKFRNLAPKKTFKTKKIASKSVD